VSKESINIDLIKESSLSSVQV